MVCRPDRAFSKSASGHVVQASYPKTPGNYVRLPGHVLPALKGATALSSPPGASSTPLTLTVVLKRTDQKGFHKYLYDVYDPHSSLFHHFLKQSELADKFGPSRKEYDQILQYLSGKGFKLVEGSANRLTLTVRGTRALAGSAFSLHIGDYRIGDRKFYANDKNPAVPIRVASSIQAVAGLSDLARPRAGSDAINKAFKAVVAWLKDLNAKTQINAASNLNQVSAAATGTGNNNKPDPPGLPLNDGTGQTVGLIEFDTFQTSDVADFLSLIGSPATLINNVSEVKVNGGATPGQGQTEVLLDIDAVLSLAPGAQIVVYDGPFTGPGVSFQSLFNAAVNGGSTIISNSWAYCENQTTLADVQSIDSIFQSAAAAGISVFNGAGDTGSTCLDGGANTVAVPADSPNATAVGGSSLHTGPGNIYDSETWWDGSLSTPPTGQGGFGVSKFFPRPPYQTGLTTSSSRSVPDVVANADPALGVMLCQASTGGCPDGRFYGGTSIAAPIWASFAAQLNQALGHSIGAFNQSVYPYANTSAFHNAASLSSDFAHVGLGSPNVDQLYLALSGTTAGTPDAALSKVISIKQAPLFSTSIPAISADGTSQGFVNVVLLDANGNPVPGRTVTLSPTSGSNVQISPSSAVTTLSNGTATFTLTDLTPETITITARDTTDNIVLTNTATVPFVVPPAAGAGINAFPTTVNADNVSTATITLTLQDALGRPTPGKLVTLSQGGGHSIINGPTPSVTDSNGQIQFTAVDQVAETVTYSATDITDGNLPFPATGAVQYINGPANGCGNGNPIAAPGFLVTPYATGFVSQNFSYGNINFGGCPGAYGIAFDNSGNLYVGDAPTGSIYKFPPGGGVAGSATLLTPTPIGPSLGQLAVDANGNLFAGRSVTSSSFNGYLGAVYRIDPNNGAVLNTFGTDLKCPEQIAIDPRTNDLFVGDSCGGGGSDSQSLWRISNPSGSPSESLYATMPGGTNASIAFAPSGTFYVWDYLNSVQIVKVSGTNGPTPPTLTTVPGLVPGYLGLLAGGTQANGDANFLVYNYSLSGAASGSIGIADLTANPPSISTVLVNSGVVNNNNLAVNPADGCIYLAEGNAVFKITDESGACKYTAPQPAPAIALTPTTVSPNPSQGTSQTFAAALHYVSAPSGVPIFFQVAGANPQVQMVKTDSNGQASFTYTAVKAGTDTVSASATINSSSVVSNPVQFTWLAGLHSTFLTLNPSPSGSTLGTPVTAVASLTDMSANPATPLAGQSVSLSLDGDTCFATTDANGMASCVITPAIVGMRTLSASFSGDTQLLASTDSKGFSVSGVAADLSYTGPTTFSNGSPAALSAVLTNVQTKSPISGEDITFNLGSGANLQTCSGTTDSTGTAGCSIGSVNQPVGAGTLTSSFAGNLNYQPTSVQTSVTINSQQVSVPNVTGLTQAAAASAIQGAGLVVGNVTTASSTTVPAGSVISQSPTSGTSVAPGSSVDLVVSSGPAQVQVPNVVNLPQDCAASAIRGAGLVVGNVTAASSKTVPAGFVISQSPTSGTLVDPDSSVALVVSSGPKTYRRPKLDVWIGAERMGPSGTLFIDLKLTNIGQEDAVNVKIGHLSFRTLCGNGRVTYSPELSGKLPLRVGNIVKGTSITVTLALNVPGTVTGFFITESGRMRNTAGSLFRFSGRQMVTLCRDWNNSGQFGFCENDACGHERQNDISF
jgi:hypothetical protein